MEYTHIQYTIGNTTATAMANYPLWNACVHCQNLMSLSPPCNWHSVENDSILPAVATGQTVTANPKRNWLIGNSLGTGEKKWSALCCHTTQSATAPLSMAFDVTRINNAKMCCCSLCKNATNLQQCRMNGKHILQHTIPTTQWMERNASL